MNLHSTTAATVAALRKQRHEQLRRQVADARERLRSMKRRGSADPGAKEGALRDVELEIARLEKEMADLLSAG